MTYRYRTIIIIAAVSGAIFLTMVHNFLSAAVAIYIAIFSIFFTIGTFLLLRSVNKPEEFVEHFGEADVLNRMWYPIQEELMDVVNGGGQVTEPASAWNTAPSLSKRETNRNFFTGMQRYVQQREHVAALAAGDLSTEESRQELASEQESLLSMALELIVQVNRAIDENPASATVARRTRRARPSPQTQRKRSATARPAPPLPRPTSMRIVETPRKPSTPQPASRPTPLRISDVLEPPEPAIAPPAPSAPEPALITSAPPKPVPSVASVPEVVEESKRPEPVVPAPPQEPVATAPAPSVPEPAAPSIEPPADLRLDVASVCEELFNPKMMSYQTNRLFDERYKDVTVRWIGTDRRASAYSYDFNFGDGGGTKAELDVYEVKQQYGSRAVRAFVQLPIEAADDIGGRIGDEVQFEGRLITCEGSARRLYIADAQIVD